MRGIYQITVERPDGSELVYVGSAETIERRWRRHIYDLRKGIHDNEHFQNAYDKYGEARLRWSVLEEVPGEDDDELVAAEQNWYDYLLAAFGLDNLINKMRPEKSPMRDPAVVRRFVETYKGQYETPAWQENFRRGIESRANNESWLVNTAEANRKKAQDPEWRKRHQAAIEQKLTKTYVAVSPEGIELSFRNLSAFCREHGLDPGKMVLVAQGKREHHKGWKCRYADEDKDEE